MTWEHDRVEELLAAHALGGLDAEDAALAERALEEHVVDCERCRRAWDGYREVAADLALAASAVAPSELSGARLRRSLRNRDGVRPLAAAATVAASALLVAFAGFMLVRSGQLGDRLQAAEATQNSLFDVVSTVARPEHETIRLTGASEAGAELYYVPGEERGYLMAANLPPPRHEYHVWFRADGQVWHAGVLDVESGRAVLSCKTDPTKWDAVMLIDEPPGPAPDASPLVSATMSSS